ncbi:hypothetical protein ABPG72_000093 [Tetrahymena utriculariae]
MSIVEVRVCGRYKLGSRIGTGSFGSIYLAKNVQTNTEVAVKMEEIKSRHPQLLYEGKIMQNLQGGIGIPNMHWCGQEGDYNFLVMELLGQNMEELFNLCNKKFSLKATLMIADQIISNLEYIHFKTYVHRDMKPENFLVGLGKKSKNIFTIDFGLSKRYRDSRTHEHIQFRDKKPLIGTCRYASLNAHKGYEQSRRDDLESLGYILIYFLKGSLPWQGIKTNSRDQKQQTILDMKTSIPVEELCKGLPPEFAIYINYCRNLKFEDKPDYTYLKKIFKERFVKEGYQFDYVYDWILIPLSNRNPTFTAKIPITVELIPNEDQFIKENQESDDSKDNMPDDTSDKGEENEISNYYQQQQAQGQNQFGQGPQQQYYPQNQYYGQTQNNYKGNYQQQQQQIQQQQQQLKQGNNIQQQQYNQQQNNYQMQQQYNQQQSQQQQYNNNAATQQKQANQKDGKAKKEKGECSIF